MSDLVRVGPTFAHYYRGNVANMAVGDFEDCRAGADSRSVVLELQSCLIVADNYCPQDETAKRVRSHRQVHILGLDV
jgi:hypothetical protein